MGRSPTGDWTNGSIPVVLLCCVLFELRLTPSWRRIETSKATSRAWPRLDFLPCLVAWSRHSCATQSYHPIRAIQTVSSVKTTTARPGMLVTNAMLVTATATVAPVVHMRMRMRIRRRLCRHRHRHRRRQRGTVDHSRCYLLPPRRSIFTGTAAAHARPPLQRRVSLLQQWKRTTTTTTTRIRSGLQQAPLLNQCRRRCLPANSWPLKARHRRQHLRSRPLGPQGARVSPSTSSTSVGARARPHGVTAATTTVRVPPPVMVTGGITGRGVRNNSEDRTQQRCTSDRTAAAHAPAVSLR